MPSRWYDQMVNLVNTGSRYSNSEATRVTGTGNPYPQIPSPRQLANEKAKQYVDNIAYLQNLLALI